MKVSNLKIGVHIVTSSTYNIFNHTDGFLEKSNEHMLKTFCSKLETSQEPSLCENVSTNQEIMCSLFVMATM